MEAEAVEKERAEKEEAEAKRQAELAKVRGCWDGLLSGSGWGRGLETAEDAAIVAGAGFRCMEAR